ncbi:MAG TPA: bifunctional phosphopantothenoylcysteine decarboxylase/phosphopantothenate--cysteine ligase CoaBC [Candidatus Limnocylindria bacterium]|nr:bifunctional phosphopantothenoylcysteine decarboxylase/phosphopantothenate--cysteine ligase CoaBC [Candidatus Limnocylindria bacterium]
MSDAAGGGPLVGRLVLLAVTGSIAAYKSAELARALVAEGADVQPLMTHSAQAFLGPLTLQTLTRRRPLVDALELLPDGRIAHIVAADSADAILVAPATARWLAAMASGLADDVVTATCLASAAPVVVAPAMDGEMYEHPATRANVERLRSFGYTIVEPEVGPLASGAVGRGRLAEPAQVMVAVRAAVDGRPIRQPDDALRPPLETPAREQDLHGWHVVVTAGGTAEPIDPVRFIGNRSSGRMGVALAEAALARGARVTLIHAQTSVPLPEAARLIHAPTTAQMRAAVLDALDGADALVMAAAVSDFRPRHAAGSKLSRQDGLTLELEPTEDILAEASAAARRQARRPLLVGFAAETGSLERAPEKAARKGVDLLVANDVAEEGSGFGTVTNRVSLIRPGEVPEEWPLLSKREVADRLLDRLLALRGREGASLPT